MKIEDLPNLMLSPLAGYTDAGFRNLAKQYGCGFTVTEMVSAKALSLNNIRTKELLFCKEKGVISVQLFGNDPNVFAEVAKSPLLDKFDIIDINMGCPQRKIVSNGEGCALMKQPYLAAKIVSAVKQNTNKLVSAKFRKGFGDSDTCVDFAKAMEDAGADFVVLHARSCNQVFSGKADWNAVQRVVNAVNIPVFANGDIVDKESFDEVKKISGCYGVAIGRGAVGKPYLFSLLLDKPYTFDIYSAVCQHIAVLKEIYPDMVVANEIKKHIVAYIKGKRDCKGLVASIMPIKDTQGILDRLKQFVNANG